MKYRKLLWVALLVFSVLGGHSMAARAADGLKIGLVDFQRALNEVEEGKQAKANLKSQFDAKQKALASKQEELKKLKDTLEGQQAALSAEVMRQKEAEYRDKFLELQKVLAQYRQEMATKEGEITQKIVIRLRQVVDKVGSQGGYNMIFEKSQDAVLYAPGATDLTTDVIKSFNAGGGGK